VARTESRTKTAIWSDDDFRKLTARAQRMYWLLYSQATINLCGVVALTVRKWAGTAVDETAEFVADALRELEEHRYLIVDWDHEEVLVRTFVRHDGVARSPKTFQAAREQAGGISSPAIRAAVDAEFARLADTPSDTPSDSPSDGVSHTPSRPLVDTPPDTPPDRPRTRARAVSVSSLRLPSPTPTPSPDPINGSDVLLRNGTRDGRDSTRELQLTHQLADLCTAENRNLVRSEAGAVVVWALAQVDHRIVEESFTWAMSHPPVLPRAVAEIIARKAHDRGVTIRGFRPLVDA
jgi:hypothetical protein